MNQASQVGQPDLAAQSQEQEPQQASLLDTIIENSKLARDPDQRDLARDMIGEFVKQVLDGSLTVAKNTKAMINAGIARLDELLTDQLNEVMHTEDFQKLEASWRGLHYLVHQTETGDQLKIRVINATKEELVDDMTDAPDFDQSALWNKVYEEEYGMFGGEPYGLLVGDYEFTRHPQDVFLLGKISNVAAAAHAPFLSSASPLLFGWDSFSELRKHRSLATIFEGDDSINWRAFRDSEDSRYVALALPHILMRLPYGRETKPVKSFNFEEDVDGKNHSKYLWGNAAYALASRVTDAFAKYHWCSAIQGVQGGGLVEGLPVHVFKTDDGEIASKCPTEIAISDRREKEFSDLGFMALLYRKNSDQAAFFGAQSCQKPKSYGARKPEANASAELSAQIPYILSTSRFAHYLKSLMRDYIGAPMSRVQIERFLNEWINQYVVSQDDATITVKAENPLREARIDVVDISGKPGAYKAVAYLRPHFMLQQIKIALRLVTELPPPSAGSS